MRLPELPRRTAGAAIRLYQLSLSAVIGRYCRHAPTCSDYAREAITRHGLWAGGWMGLARICRCHPWGSHGFDPVPPRPAAARWYAPWRYGRWAVKNPDEPVNGVFRHGSACAP